MDTSQSARARPPKTHIPTVKTPSRQNTHCIDAQAPPERLSLYSDGAVLQFDYIG